MSSFIYQKTTLLSEIEIENNEACIVARGKTITYFFKKGNLFYCDKQLKFAKQILFLTDENIFEADSFFE